MTTAPTKQNEQVIIRGSSTWWIYMIVRGGILRAFVNGTEDALAITGRTLLLVYLVYCGAKAGAFLVAPKMAFPMWLEMFMFVLQLGGLEGSIPGLARRAKVLKEQNVGEDAEKIRKVMLSARFLTIACMAEGALHYLLTTQNDVMKYVSAILLVVRGVVITGFLIELAKMDSEGPHILSRDEHEREQEAEQLASEQAQTIANLQSQLDSKQEEVSSLRVQLDSGQEQVSSLRVQLDGRVSSVQSQLDTRIAELDREVSSLQHQLDTERKKVSSVQHELDTRIAELDTLHVQLNSKEGQLTSLKETVANGTKWHESNTEAVVSSVQSQLDRERERVSSLQNQLDSRIAEVDTERKKVSSVQLTLSTVQLQMDSKVSSLQQQLDTQIAEVDTLRVQLDREVSSRKDEVDTLRGQLDAEQKKVKSHQQQLGTEQSELSTLRVQLSSVQSQLGAEQKKVSGLQAQLATEQEMVSTLRQELNKREEKSRIIELPTSRTRKNGQDDNAIGEQVRALLKAEPGLTGRAIAARINCSPTTASKWKELIEKEAPERAM